MASGYFYFKEMFAAQKNKFSIKDFLSKCGKKFVIPENVRKRISGVFRRYRTADLVTFTEEILNEKLHFLRKIADPAKDPRWNFFQKNLTAFHHSLFS